LSFTQRRNSAFQIPENQLQGFASLTTHSADTVPGESTTRIHDQYPAGDLMTRAIVLNPVTARLPVLLGSQPTSGKAAGRQITGERHTSSNVTKTPNKSNRRLSAPGLN